MKLLLVLTLVFASVFLQTVVSESDPDVHTADEVPAEGDTAGHALTGVRAALGSHVEREFVKITKKPHSGEVTGEHDSHAAPVEVPLIAIVRAAKKPSRKPVRTTTEQVSSSEVTTEASHHAEVMPDDDPDVRSVALDNAPLVGVRATFTRHPSKKPHKKTTRRTTATTQASSGEETTAAEEPTLMLEDDPSAPSDVAPIGVRAAFARSTTTKRPIELRTTTTGSAGIEHRSTGSVDESSTSVFGVRAVFSRKPKRKTTAATTPHVEQEQEPDSPSE